MEDETSAVLVVRAWAENDGLRVRLTSAETTAGSRAGTDFDVAVATSVSDAADAVQEWLEEFLNRAGEER